MKYSEFDLYFSAQFLGLMFIFPDHLDKAENALTFLKKNKQKLFTICCIYSTIYSTLKLSTLWEFQTTSGIVTISFRLF